MARIQKGKTFANLELQAGWKVSTNDDGTLTGSCTFRGENANLSGILPKKGTPHPKHNKMQSFRSEGTADELGLATVTVDYIGLMRDPSEVKGSFNASLNQEAIETHKDFITVIGGKPSAPLNGAQFDEDGHFKGFPASEGSPSANDLAGVTGYLRPGVIFRATFFTAKPENFRLDQVGKVINTPPGLPKNVKVPSGANWLIGPSTMEEYGTVLKITIDYMLSGKMGWNMLVYPSI